jgi:glycolate oxidase
VPKPPVTAVAVFGESSAAGRAAADVMAAVTPSVLELMDNATIRIVENWRPMGLDTSAGCVLMAQFDDGVGAAEADADRFVAIAERAGASEIHRSETPEEAEMLLGARRMAILAIEEAGDWLLDDIAVPRSRLAEALGRIEDISAHREVSICTFGHAGDGNLHPTIITERGDTDARARAMEAFDDILELALDLGGTITGEHGIGNLKQRMLSRELDEVARDLHTRVKAAWDPDNILNPGKSLPRW